ncbi:MAG: hypothetical protein M0R47_20440 [Methylobacter sp.]|jgi:hypothetical protein|uniref:hypothetical protein n=1 Tax=Methylobacter sp. TaxID=2051955 RepID=UPI0025FBBF24|nr:hypothetical protein [Methylobacter sp.]MCK9622891.1 hypothetical protein [Methylobacter sp.]
MSRGKPYFSGLTKTQLTQAIRDELKRFAFREEFESPLITGLIAEKHYYCSKRGIKPTRFRMLFRPGAAYDFEGFFPEHGWHKVSWNQCIRPRDEYDWIKMALRYAIKPIIAKYKALHPVCEKCGAHSEHVDHVAPEFDEIATQAISLLDEKLLEEAFARFNWWSEEQFSLPDSNPAVQYILAAHKTAELRAVCQPCHVKSSSERRYA